MAASFLVLGSGMQGTAAAYDLAKFSGADEIYIGDLDLNLAVSSSERVNKLTGRESCLPIKIDVQQKAALLELFKKANVVLSCVPYWMHPEIAAVAIDAGVNMCDLGGNTEITWKTLGLDEVAKKAGVSLVPDCGLAPGLVNSLGMYLIEQMDSCESVKLYCGVLPQNPKPPFNYKLTFNIEGLVTEYDYQAIALRNGQITKIDTLDEIETIWIEQLGQMEAFTTSGGTSTAPYTLQDRIRNYEYKTIRFPGHCERMRIFKDFGFWEEKPVKVKGVLVRPKDFFCRVFGDKLRTIEDLDQCAIRAIGVGTKADQPINLQLDLFDRQDEETGFTSMERLTGFSISIVAQQIAAGLVAKGCVRYEQALTGTEFLKRLARRGIEYKVAQS